MPPFDQTKQSGLPLRIMLYGPAKYKKTWWAGKAAESGFNVIFADGDDGTSILSQIKEDARKRVYVLDGIDSATTPNFCYLITRIMRDEDIKLWDEQDKTELLIRKNAKPDHSYFSYQKSKLTINDVLVIDSWSALVQSLVRQYMLEQKKDYTKKAVIDSDWKDYRWTGYMADWVLGQFKTFPCNIIVIAHETTFEKKDKEDPNKVILSKVQAGSTSNNQALRMAKYFSDIIYFSAMGENIYVDTRVDASRDGGCRNVPPVKKRWEELQFIDFANGAGIKSTGAPMEAFTFMSGQAVIDAAASSGLAGMVKSAPVPEKVEAAQPLISSTTGAVTMSSLMGQLGNKQI